MKRYTSSRENAAPSPEHSVSRKYGYPVSEIRCSPNLLKRENLLSCFQKMDEATKSGIRHPGSCFPRANESPRSAQRKHARMVWQFEYKLEIRKK
ncbi:MAG: hypothetical protein CVU71_12865 [Deltaproteobacteria bacterium HGW-Deltaproteobacteria-6]|nr:MAG: hypothetical protein CVU71_12865 [Deltaproteobacteria bacterium HGW-Deltaproteobacteria-6]